MDKQSAPDDAVTPLASDPVAPPGKALNGASGGDVAAHLTLPAQAGMFGWLTNHPTGFWFFFWGELAERLLLLRHAGHSVPLSGERARLSE